MLFSGLTIAEKNTKLTGFGETEKYLTVSNINKQKIINLKFMGQIYSFDITNVYKLVNKIKKLKISNIPFKAKTVQNFKIIWFNFPILQNIQKILATRGL